MCGSNWVTTSTFSSRLRATKDKDSVLARIYFRGYMLHKYSLTFQALIHWTFHLVISYSFLTQACRSYSEWTDPSFRMGLATHY